MMTWSINLLVLSVGLLIVGLIKPKWILFWMDKPGRLPVIIISSVLFMVAAVMFGEANLEKKQTDPKLTQQSDGNKEVPDTPAPAAVEAIKTESIKQVDKASGNK